MKMTYFHVLCPAMLQNRQKEKFYKKIEKISIFSNAPFKGAAPTLTCWASGPECGGLQLVQRVDCVEWRGGYLGSAVAERVGARESDCAHQF